jgi:UDP-glucose 4-epimerase
MQVVTGKRPLVNVFGDDYDTKDGSGIRDFIHVMDLAEGHLTALNHINANRGAFTFNLGTGRGTSVLELISECEKVSGTKINITRKPRRAGDVAECWADNSYATDCLNWTPSRSLRAMCEDSWRWEKMRVDGVK